MPKSGSRKKRKSVSKTSNLSVNKQDLKNDARNSQKIPNCSPALFNDLILDCVFGFLKVEDIKACRLVCHGWNKLAEPQLRKRSKVSISSAKNNTIEQFTLTFAHSESQLPFGCVVLENKSDDEENEDDEDCEGSSMDDEDKATKAWSLLTLNKFFTNWQNQITSLALNDVDIYKRKNNRSKSTKNKDVEELSEYVLSPTLQRNLSSLTINCNSAFTNIYISVDNLQSIKFIDLCEVMLEMGTNGLKITAPEVELDDIDYLQNGEKLKTVLINDFVDFSKTKDISLAQRHTTLSLDMTEDITIDKLHLEDIEILNYADAKWNVKQMSLCGIPWTKKNQIKISSLEFSNSTLDLAALPPTIECLKVEYIRRKEVRVVFSSPIIFDKLQYLSLSLRTGNSESILRLLKNCPKLTDVFYEHILTNALNIEWLPPTIRRLEITDRISLNSGRNVPFELETLILLDFWNSNEWKKVIRCFNYEKLVIATSRLNLECISSSDYHDWLKTTIRKFSNGNKRIDIYAGPVALHKKSPFLKCVNMSSINVEKATEDNLLIYWFRFTSRLGEAIEETEFNHVRKLVNSERCDKYTGIEEVGYISGFGFGGCCSHF